MQHRARRNRDTGSASEALADIALNMLGLVLIVLLVYILMFQQTTAKLAVTTQELQVAAASKVDPEPQPSTTPQVKAEHSSDLWRFRIDVDGLVDDSGRRSPADFTVEYFIHLNIQGDSITGMLFGVKEEHQDGGASSASHAKIDGDLKGSRANLELHFTGFANGASERLIVTRMGETWIGRLESGKCIPGANNYVGEAVGTRLDESVFAGD